MTAFTCFMPEPSWSAEKVGDDLLGERKRRAGAGAAGDDHNAKRIRRLVDERQLVLRRSVGSRPALDNRRRAAGEDMRIFLEDQVVDGGRREGIGRRRVVMG